MNAPTTMTTAPRPMSSPPVRAFNWHGVPRPKKAPPADEQLVNPLDGEAVTVAGVVVSGAGAPTATVPTPVGSGPETSPELWAAEENPAAGSWLAKAVNRGVKDGSDSN